MLTKFKNFANNIPNWKTKLVESDSYIYLMFFSMMGFMYLGFSSDPKTVLLLYAAFTFLINLKVKNILLSLFLMFIFIMPFFIPNKYYVIEVLKSFERAPDINLSYNEGYYLGYGLIISNIFLALSVWGVMRNTFLKVSTKTRLKHLSILFISMVLFLLNGFYSTLTYSPFPELSVVWLLQYSQMFLVAIVLIYCFQNYEKTYENFHQTIISSAVLEIFLGVFQFVKQSSFGLPIEFGKSMATYLTGLDEVESILRPYGSLVQTNQFALVMLALFVIIVPYVLRKKSTIYIWVVIGILMTIVLTQSRTIWIATAGVVIFTYRLYKYEINKKLKGFIGRKVLIYVVLGLMPLLWILIPRILLSINLPEQGAGLPIRLKMITEGWEAFILNPFVGYGPGTNEWVLFNLFPEGVVKIFPAAVHFAYLQFLLEVGILGVFFFIMPFVYIYKKGYNTRKDKDYWYVFIAGVMVFAVYYLFHPHAGILEFPYLGLNLGFGYISVYLYNKKND